MKWKLFLQRNRLVQAAKLSDDELTLEQLQDFFMQVIIEVAL